MNVIDALNRKFGKATIGSALVGTRVAQWELVKKDRSKRYTTQWEELLELKNKQIN
jgi:DNA polymerase V